MGGADGGRRGRAASSLGVNLFVLFFAPMALMVDRPYLALVPALVCTIGWTRYRPAPRARLLLFTAIAWVAYAAYETRMYFWAKTVTAPIRVDLLLFGPALYVVTLGALVRWWNLRRAAVGALLLLVPLAPARAQRPISWERDRGVTMVRSIRHDLEKYYYDSTYHGIDPAAHFDSVIAAVNQASSPSEIFGLIAGSLLPLNDSHTRFWPPAWRDEVEYPWELSMIGDTCYVIGLRPGTDTAALGGLAVGDAILAMDNFLPTRRDFWKLGYLYGVLRPSPVVQFVARAPGGQPRRVTAHAKVIPGKSTIDLTGSDGGTDIWNLIRRRQDIDQDYRDRFVGLGKDVLVWRMREFDAPDQVDAAMHRASDYAALVIDLRGNGGGAVSALMRLTGSLIDRVDTIATGQQRDRRVPEVSKPTGHHYPGKLIILVDHRSASASEALSKTVQVAGRGVVLGDTTQGALMTSRYYGHQTGSGEATVFYGVSVSVSDYVASDGTRPETTGITPDELVLPSGADLAAHRDPVLARALARLGKPLSPEDAGKLFPQRGNP
jgi:C-terminal processing protease CtpA/Prc